MKAEVQILDVTLRDGGYRNDFKFTLEYAQQHIQQMVESGVDWVEIGYRNGSFKTIGDIGITGLSEDSYISALRDSVSKPCLCVMAHPKNIAKNDIGHLRRLGVNMLRFCMDIQRAEVTSDYIKEAKAQGMTVCLNLTRLSKQPLQQLVAHASLASEAGADVLYLADSNGSLTPSRVGNLVRLIRETSGLELGFHAHDNLGLATANSIAAIDAGATFIDASLRGMGKGAGNLKLESWLIYLRLAYKADKYNCRSLLEQVEILEGIEALARPVQPLDDLILGMFDLTIDDKARITASANNIGEVYANALV
ncbi:nucleoid-structuring protein H-NS [Pseudomonas sp. zjy_15]|uniref:nucleoid-structuring protein H-NS n=1 Tax=unclassified Pseudomonas TaxID=196821 RepID=UPI00370AB368